MIASFAANLALRVVAPRMEFPYTLPWIVGLSALVWVPVTFLTRPTDGARLASFVERVRPIGAWGRFRTSRSETSVGRWFLLWGVGVVSLYLFLFGGGWLVLGRPVLGALLLVPALAGAVILFRMLRKERWS
jgi:hypothetical protein